MFRLYLPFFLLLLNSITVYAQSDEEAILQVLQAETEAFVKKSMADIAKEFWILDEYTLVNVTLVDGVTLHMSKDDLLADDNIPPPNHATFLKSNHKVRVVGAIAFESHDQIVTLEDGSKVISHEIFILEKVGGIWKIHASSIQQYRPN